jgi:hypothetical protein
VVPVVPTELGPLSVVPLLVIGLLPVVVPVDGLTLPVPLSAFPVALPPPPPPPEDELSLEPPDDWAMAGAAANRTAIAATVANLRSMGVVPFV